MAQIKDRNNPEYQKYFNELMNTHDLRIKYTDEFLAKGTKVSSADEALGIKAVDYIALAPKLDVNQAYQWLSQSVNAVKGESAGATIFYFLQMSLDIKKAEKAYAAAAVLASAKKLSQARTYCQKAIGLNENYGAPYILIANLYAMSPNWSDESALNKCTYFVIIDKLQRAKQVDPSVAEEANKLIGRYSAHTPQAKDLFMLGYKAGDRITIGGWIGESTTIR